MDSNNNHYDKYLKYKNKYLKIKYYQIGSSNTNPKLRLKVMTWNILASYPTKYHFESGKMESEEQRMNRHVKIIKTIKKNKPDVILLQECDYFFKKYCEENLQYYTIIFDKKGKEGQTPFGCGILYRKKKFTKPEYFYIDTDSKKYASKNALYLKLKFNNKELSFVSFHLPGSNTSKKDTNYLIDSARLTLIKEIREKISNTNTIIGGDLNFILHNNMDNSNTTEYSFENVSTLFNYDNFNMGMKSHVLEKSSNISEITTCKFDYQEGCESFSIKPESNPVSNPICNRLIDRIYVSDNITISRYYTDTSNVKNCSKFKIYKKHNKIGYPSDHFPIIAELEL